MATTSAEDRLNLIRDALFPEDDYSGLFADDDYCEICDGPCCDFADDGPNEYITEDEIEQTVLQLSRAATDAVDRLSVIISTGSDSEAIAASSALLGYQLALADRA